MKYFIIAFFSFLLITSNVFAIDIDNAHRVKNRPPGYCAWCCLEMLGRHHKIESLYNLSKNRVNDKAMIIIHADGRLETLPIAGAVPITIQDKLDKLKVKYTMQLDGSKDTTILQRATQEGCVVDIKPGIFGLQAHAILLTHYDEEKVEFIDPNQPEHVYHCKRKWFDNNWTGRAIIIEK